MKNISFKTVLIVLIVCATISALAYFTPNLLGVLIFTVISGVALFYYYFQPLSEYSSLRKSHPVAKSEIDKVEKVLAQNRADLIAREKVINEELSSLVRKLRAGRDKLMEIETIQTETKFNGHKDLTSGFDTMAETTIKNLVKAFLELSESDAKLYFDQIGIRKDILPNTESNQSNQGNPQE